MENNEPLENPEHQEPPPSLMVQDLAVIKKALELAADRGAFKLPEFQDIGVVFTKLDQFLRYVEQVSTVDNQPKGETND